MVSLRLYDHPKLMDGNRCYFVVGETADGNSVELLNPASLECGEVARKLVARGTPVKFRADRVRENMLNKVRLAKRAGRKIPKPVLPLLSLLGAAARRLRETELTEQDPKVRARRQRDAEQAAKRKILDEALYNQRLAAMQRARDEDEMMKTQKAKAVAARIEKGALPGESKIDVAIRLVCRPEGATHAECQVHVGWKSVNWNKLQDRVTIVRTEKVPGGKTRFWGELVAAPAKAAA
jgi:hypothetical protein